MATLLRCRWGRKPTSTGIDRGDAQVNHTVTSSNGVAEGYEGRAHGRNQIDDVYLHREGHAARAGCAR
jgi:hypothetical protein